MLTQLLTTKLYIPPVRPEMISRPHLIERLNAGLRSGRKLTLIAAPAGFGKTTLLSAWVRQSETAVAWVSLNEEDNDLTRFLAYFVAALQTIQAGMGETALAVFHAAQPQPPLEAVLTTMINEIATVSDNFALVLDDYHLIAAQPIHDVLAFLLQHLPDNMHLVISTRSDPPLPLARLRGRGQLAELRSADLRFTSDQVAEFLEQTIGLKLAADDVAALTSRTEGWIAGLQMAAISMQGRDAKRVASFIHSFTGSNRFILDYLLKEVLQRQPKSVQTLLLQTAILDRLTGPLCDAVTGINEPANQRGGTTLSGQAMLEELERANLFIVPLDDERRWYRYHHLFAELLRSQLSRTQPELLPSLHRRASDWFEQEGLIAEAAQHAVAAEDFDRAAALIESLSSSLLNESRPATLLRMLTRLPDESVAAHPLLCVYSAWAHFLTWKFDVIEPLLQSAESRLSDTAQAANHVGIRGRIITLRAFMAQWQGDLLGAIRLAHQALEHLDDNDLQLRSVLEQLLGDTSVLSGDLLSARQHLEKSVAAGRAAGNFYAALSSLGRLAELETKLGRLHQAATTYRQAVRLGAEWGGGQPLPGTSYAHVGLAQVHYEWNDLDEAAEHLTRGIHLGEQCGEQEIVLQGYLALARVRQAQGKENDATEALERAEAIALMGSKIVKASHVSSWRARLSLAQGDLNAAIRWAAFQEFELNLHAVPNLELEAHYLTWVRVRIKQAPSPGDRVEQATRLLERLLPIAKAGGRVGAVIEMLALHALALQAQRNVAQALGDLEQALSLAEPEGYVRVFVDEGLAMAELLRHAVSRGIAPGYVSKLLAAFDTLERETRPHAQPLSEPLSERELEVLRLLATSLSSADIAAELFIAVSTVRSHTKSIYAKLNVRRRLDAVERARELKLLSSSTQSPT